MKIKSKEYWYITDKGDLNIDITSIESNSENVQPGGIFVAIFSFCSKAFNTTSSMVSFATRCL